VALSVRRIRVARATLRAAPDFVRGEQGMIDRAHQEVTLEPHVTLTGLVPQLTTPSRDHSDLVDIWFGVQWRERRTDWEEAFARAATGWRPDPRSPSYFDLFSYTANSGLIVARRVTADAIVWRQVEEQARALVGAVNRDIFDRTPPSAPSRPSRGWTLRVRDVSNGLLASLRWVSEPKHSLPSVVPKLPIQVSHGSPTGSP
jgi:hypothetical protein